MPDHSNIPRGAGTRRFFGVIVAGLLAVLALGASVVAVDPYLHYDSPRIEGFNRWKTRFFYGQYDSKARLVHAVRPRHLVIGSSTAAGSLRPDHQLFNGEPAFNYALAGSTPHLQGMALAHALEGGTVRSVIIGVDLFSYNAFMDQRAFRQFELAVEQGGGWRGHWRRWRRELETSIAEALGYEAVADALGTVRDQGRPGAGGIYRDIRADGYWQNPRPAGMAQLPLFTTIERQYLSGGWFPEPERRYALDDGRGRSTPDELGAMLERASAAGVDVTIAIMPFHARFAEAMHEAGLWDDFDELKRRIVALAAEPRFARSGLRVWDFSGYHALSMDAVKGATRDTPWFEDSIHPTEATGDMMLLRMRGGAAAEGRVPADFGRLLDAANVDAGLAAAVAERAQYQALHPADVEQVRLIARQTAAWREGARGAPAG